MTEPDTERILIVDDNRVNRLVLEKRLAQEGYDVHPVSGGKEALQMLGLEEAAGESFPGGRAWDAVVLDVMMPGIDGLEVLRRIREVKTAIELPVIMATAKDRSEDIVKALGQGANDYVIKPIDLAVLLARLRTHISLRHTHRALQAAQKSLIEAAKMESVGYLAAGVAHEVRNPLAQIQMGVEMISQTEALQSDPQAAPVVKIVIDAVARADSIIQELMKVSTSGQLELAPGSVNALIEEARDSVAAAAEKAGVEVALDLAERLPEAPLAPAELRGVFASIMQNAIEAMADGGKLAVRTRRGGAKATGQEEGSRSGLRLREGDEVIVIEFADTGPGIVEERLQAIFDPFFTTKATGEGTGLGLSVAKKLVELHHGMIAVENRTECSGVKVTLQLPTGSAIRTTV